MTSDERRTGLAAGSRAAVAVREALGPRGAAALARLGRLRLLPARTVGAARRTPWIARQVLLVVALVGLYFLVRGLTEGSAAVATAHARRIVDLERVLHLDAEARLQAGVFGSDAVIDVANWVYIWGHWPVIVSTLLWLALRHRRSYRRLRDAMAISGALGMIVFVTYPVAPPRLVVDGLVDTVTQRSSSYRVLQPPIFVDRYAAMPSLHVGWDLLVGIAIATTATLPLLRLVGWVLPPAMTLAVLVTANHYVLDVVVGITLVLIGHVCALALERRRDRIREEAGARPGDPPRDQHDAGGGR